MSAPSFKLQWPAPSLFNWPPDPLPIAIPPPRDARTFASPFPIPADIFNAVLDWKVPVTIGAVYASTAIIANKINRERKNQPWGFSKTKAFYYFVLLHNTFLAIFSALTFIGMIRALAHTWPGRRDLPFLGKLWPGLRTQNGLAGAADALCKLHGPRDLGDAVFYNPETHGWKTTNPSVKLATGSIPDASDVGRLWNEGLAFWGWWFYLSKFYEVLDTFIILAKGKRSSTLQTYHHTGAMACMWAGIRYMSPPIWMFCFINSGIHALMYTYYTLSALRIRVPQGIKRTLTTMQITQFLVGITFASLHLFVHYSVPVSTPFTKTVSSAVSAASSAVSSAASVAASKAPVAAAGFGATLQKLLLRGIGEEGMAQKVAQPAQPAIPEAKVNATEPRTLRQETEWRTQYEYVPCIDTEGQAFAIWLNVFYLAPLTLLFVRFFVRSYMRRGAPNTKHSKPAARITKAAEDAAHGVDREVDTLGKAAENGVGDLANNVLNKFQGSTPKSASQRRVSANIGRIAHHFEKSEDEVTTDGANVDFSNNGGNKSNSSSIKGKSSNESLRVRQIRKKASAEHNKLRQKFESGPEAFGRSVDSPHKEGTTKVATGTECPSDKLSPCVEDEDAEREKVKQLEEEAESKVRGVREAVGGQGSRSVEDMDLSGGPDAAKDKAILAMESSKFSDTDFSLVDVREENSTKAIEEAESSLENDKDGSARDSAEELKDASRPSTPSPKQSTESIASIDSSLATDKIPDLSTPSESTRSPSPRRLKSKIPQLATKRSMSPAKKILTPATTTTSIAAHSSPVLERKKSTSGKADT